MTLMSLLASGCSSFKMADVREVHVEGTCQLMCPLNERLARERQQRLHIFEIMKGTEGQRQPKGDPSAVVKEFTRCAAGKDIGREQLRPANVLLITMNYLIDNIADRNDQPWHVVYSFMSDRIRAIRQDMVVQRISGSAAISLLEKALRFYIFAGYKLCESNLEIFSPELNNKHIQECFNRLLGYYDNEEARSCQNRAEFECYYLLFNLRSNDAEQHFMALPRCIFYNTLPQLALDINKSALQGNFVRFFRSVKKLPFLASCAVHKWFRQVQAEALKVMNIAFSSHVLKFPLDCFAETLDFNTTQEAEEFCSFYGIQATTEVICFLKGSFQKKDHFFTPRRSSFIDKKCTGSMKELFHGITRESTKFPEDPVCGRDDIVVGKPVGKKKGIGRGWIGMNKRLPTK